MNNLDFTSNKRSKIFPVIGIILIIFFIFIGILTFASLYFGTKSDFTILQSGNVGIVEVTGVILDSRKIIEDLEKFRSNDNVKAIIFRVDSPGGTVGSAQELYEEINRIKKEKPVIASLGNMATSGGYYSVASASVIVANPSTITGSIGVIVQMINFSELAKWAKLKPIILKSGKYKDSGSGWRGLTDEERKLWQDVLDDIHDKFIEDVARGRNLGVDEVKMIADARIFTARKAMKYGLVDKLGGLEYAKDIAKEVAKIQGEIEAVYPTKSKMEFLDMFLDNNAQGKVQQFFNKTMLSKFDFLLMAPISDMIIN